MLYDDGTGPWGLFDSSYGTTNPKAGAFYVHNLTTVLADTASFTAGYLNYAIANAPATVHSLLLQKGSATGPSSSSCGTTTPPAARETT